MAWWIPLLIGGAAGLFKGAADMRSQSRENQAAADQENTQRQLELDARNMDARFGIESGTRRAAKLEDLANIFREFGEKDDPYRRRQERLAQQMMGEDGRGRLQAEAQRQLERGSGFMDSVLAGRGMYSSGYGTAQQRMLASETMGSLAQAIAQNQMQGMAGASDIYSGLSQSDMQRQMATLQGLQGVYSDQAWGVAGMNPEDYYLSPDEYMWEPPKPTAGDWLLGGLGSLFGGAASVYGADPGTFNKGFRSVNWSGRYDPGSQNG